MRIAVKTGRRLGACVSSLLVLAALGGVARAEPVDERELERWVPAISIVTGLGVQRAEGHLSTSDVVDIPFFAPLPPNAPQPIVPGSPATNRVRMMTPFVGLGMEVTAPSWTPLPGHPRLFGRVDVSYAFGPEYKAPTIGDPGPFVIGQRSSGAFTSDTIIGQGGETVFSVRPLWVMAGAGLTFTFEAWDRAIRIKPSAEYLREEISIGGLVRRAVGPPDGNGTSLSEFRAITLAVEETRVYHGVGAGLEVEMDTRRAGPFVLSLYAGARAWNFPANEKKYFTATNNLTERADFTFLKNDWAFSGLLGMRFRWVPE